MTDAWRRPRPAPHAVVLRVIAAVAVMAAAIGFFSDVPVWFVSPGASRTLVALEENFNDGLLLHPDWTAVTGFVPCENGWCLTPGSQGTLHYRPRVSMDGVRDVEAYLWLYARGGVTNRVSVSGDDGRTWQTLATNVSVTGERIALRRYLGGAYPPMLAFEASNPGGATALVLDKLVLAYLDAPLGAAPSATRFFLATVGLGAAGIVLSRRPRLTAGSLLIVAVGAVLRYRLLVETLANPLDPDAKGYRAYAAWMSLFGDTGFFSARFGEREPLFVLVGHLFFRLVGDSDFHLRLVSFALSIVLIWLVMRIGTTLFGVPLGWFTGAMMALNPALARESVRGLRLELETIVLLLVLIAAFLWARPRGRLRAPLLGALGGLMVLTRITYVLAMTVLLALAAYTRRQTRRGWLVPAAASIAIMIALLAPHRYSLYRLHGDPFWDTTRYARWNANFEFAGRPGFPSRRQLELDGYAGGRLTYAEYLFGLHSLREIVLGTMRGYLKLFLSMTAKALRYEPLGLLLLLLAVAGFARACLRPEYRWLPVTFVVVEFPVAFLYDRLLVDQRHCLSSFPLVLFASALSLSWIAAGLGPAWAVVRARVGAGGGQRDDVLGRRRA
jgi:hypothetical protein